MEIGILYICVGRYKIFWKDFYISCEKNFLPNHSKFYFVFTDSDEIDFSNNSNIKIIYQKKMGWPYDTLYRFKMFQNIKANAFSLDYVFFFNANALIIEEIGDNILPQNETLVGVQHPCHNNRNPDTYIYERNPKSTAFVGKGEGEFYFMGSFSGGKALAYYNMIDYLVDQIEIDENNDIIAIWHDESHLNKYFISHQPKVLDSSYAYPEEMLLPYRKFILLRDKNKFGGHNYLRKKPSIFVSILNFCKQLFHKC